MATTHFKFIEWQNTEGLHEDAVQCISELKFLKDELHFLKDLVSEHARELIGGQSYEEATKISADLRTYLNRLQLLLSELQVHSNDLKILLDDIDEPDELKNYKDRHYKLMLNIMDLKVDVNKTKRIIFSILVHIKKKNKQRKLL